MTNYLFPVSQVETITPAIAAEYLKNNTDNRPLSKVVVSSYAHTMKRGEWMLNGSSIDFSTEGILLNGQHRLAAVVQSGCTQQFFVTRGLDPKVYTTYDCGRSRTVGQLIGMQGVPNYNTVAACIKVVYLLRHNKVVQGVSMKVKMNLTNQNMVSIFEEDRNGYIEAVRNVKSLIDPMGKACILGPGSLSGIFYHLTHDLGHDKERVIDFYSQVFSYNTASNKTLERLRIRFLKARSGTNKIANEAITVLLAKTWNAYIEGKELKCIKWDPEIEEKISFK